jgi:hypothetical protein
LMYDRPEIDTFSNFQAVSPFSSKFCAYCLVLIGLGHLHRVMQGSYAECGYETTKLGGRLLTFLPHVTRANLPVLTGTENSFVISRTCLLCYGSSPADLHYGRHHLRVRKLPASLFCKHVSFISFQGRFRTRLYSADRIRLPRGYSERLYLTAGRCMTD